ncbi:MAG: DUF2318 domain-containing protein [Deltaproteobacteria bacterium]|jgi:uncharacterized membrane protein|nr:DUF2318 domain-containing protein [Deltaproteobacteria bacterium]
MIDRKQKREQFQDLPVKKNNWLLPSIVLTVSIIALGGWWFFGVGASVDHSTVTANNDGTIRFAVAEFADGQARFYRYQGRTGPIDFFLVRSHDSVIRAAFDACDVCYQARKGYRQDGGHMVCNNCEQKFRTEMVNEIEGGCNPAPLRRQNVRQEVVVKTSDLERGAGYFVSSMN